MPTQSHYPDIARTNPCPILLKQSARLGGINFISHWLESAVIRTRDILHGKPALCPFGYRVRVIMVLEAGDTEW